MVEPPPAPPSLSHVPEGELICYGREDAAELGLWASAIWRWAQDAWACNLKAET